jgi:hypothetical protein
MQGRCILKDWDKTPDGVVMNELFEFETASTFMGVAVRFGYFANGEDEAVDKRTNFQMILPAQQAREVAAAMIAKADEAERSEPSGTA